MSPTPLTKNTIPGILLIAGVVITFVLFGLIFMEALNAHHSNETIQTDISALDQLKTELAQLDEELTQDALLAVATGDSVWQVQYKSAESQLEMVIRRAASVLDTTHSGSELDQIRKAHSQRTATEKQAIYLARHGAVQSARDLLASDDYLHRKRTYMESIELALDILNDREEFAGRALGSQLTLTVIFAGGVLLISWTVILISLRMNLKRRRLAELERERLFRELEAKNRELESFAYTISHDLKSPLITVQGFLRHVERDSLAGKHDQVCVNLKRISDAAAKMERLLNDLLNFSRAGLHANPHEEIPFGELAQEAVELVSGRIMQRNVTVEIHDNLPTIHCDRSRMLEVILNLLDNAVKFLGNQTKPHIIIGMRTDGPEPIYFVKDNGMGIDPCHHEQILNLFEKLNADSEGTGIGLALVKRIVEQHKGRIWVESEGLGKGATFCFTLARNPS
jgi:signal transduction histidine kinase